MSRIGIPTQTEIWLVVAGHGGARAGVEEWVLMGAGGFGVGDESILKLDHGDTWILNILKIGEWYT